MDNLIRINLFAILWSDWFCVYKRDEKQNNNPVNYVKIMVTEKLVDLEVILSISFEQEYLDICQIFSNKWKLVCLDYFWFGFSRSLFPGYELI